MKKIVRLTEADLTRIVKRVLQEQITGGNVALGVATGLASQAIKLINGSGNASNKVYNIINSCKSSNFPINQRTNRIADQIYNGVEGGMTSLGTNENMVYNALKQVQTFDEFCGVVKSYQSSYGKSLWNALKGDFSMESEWVQIMRPIRDAALRSQQSQQSKQQGAPKTGQQPRPGTGAPKTGQQPRPGTTYGKTGQPPRPTR